MRAVGIIFSNIHDKNVAELARIRTLGSIPFARSYRLTHFPLSNIVSSVIDTVGIITKNNYQSLMDHVGSGKDWDLARKDGGVIILPPYGNAQNSTLYNSRLEALKGITNFLFRADEDYVIMTDCDAVCRMNYNEIIDNHIKNHADITLVYKKRTLNEDEIATELELTGNRVTGVNQKSENDGNEANIFANVFVIKRTLLQNIVLDSISHNYSHFMSDVVARNIKSMRIIGYEHKGFFAGITSLQAYYDSNLLLLNRKVRDEIFGDRSVFTKIRDSAPTKYGNSAIVKNSMIADGCVIEGEVENSILFRNVKVGRGSVVRNSIVMQNAVLGENCTLDCIITDKNVTVTDRKYLSGSANHPFYIAKGIMI